MSDDTPRLALPTLAPTGVQPQVTHNEALYQLDALVFARFLDRDLSAPPPSPADGDSYLVKATATGAWTGNDATIAYALDGGWRFFAPFTGLAAYVVDEAVLLVFNGTAWVDYASILSLQNVPLLGVNATADTTNRLSVKSAALLFDNIGNGVQAKLNKHAAGDTASLLYQDNYSARAEIGLTGDDNFHFKVSPDGSTFYDAIVLDRTSGKATLLAAPCIGGLSTGSLVFAGASGQISQNNAKLFWDNTGNALGIGTAVPDAPLCISLNSHAAPVAPLAGCLAHFMGADASGTRLQIDAYGNSPQLIVQRADGTSVAPAAVATGETLFSFASRAYDGSAYQNGGQFQFVTAETWDATHRGTDMRIQLNANGSTTLAAKFICFNDGRIQPVGAYSDLSYSWQQPATGFAITIADLCGRLILAPAGTLATGTITLPASPKDGQLFRVSSIQTVTALTFAANTGQSITGALTTLTANGFAEYTYRSANTTWYRTG